MAKKIEGVEIFATGTWRASTGKVSVGSAMLDDIVNNYAAIGATPGYVPVIKLGHTDRQKWFGQDNGAPNLGFATNVRRKGDKVLADFDNVPEVVFDLIANKRYNSVSIELSPKIEHEGKTFTNVLTAVALLGAELPAVKGLKELSATLYHQELPGDKQILEHDMPGENPAMFTQAQVDALVNAAVTAARAEEKAKFEDEKTALTAAKDKAEADKAEAVKRFQTYETDVLKKANADMVDAAIKEGKLLPKHKDMALAFAAALPVSIQFGSETKSAQAMFKEFIEGLPKGVDLKTKTGEGADKKFEGTGEEAGEEVHKLSQEKVTKSAGKMSYAEARQAVLLENPDIASAYAGQ